jgi:RimJ/RimL family protein N-acetyltransferase
MRLDTARLVLLPLTAVHLAKVLEGGRSLELELVQALDAQILDANMIRAIGLKIEKMSQRPVEEHPWLTYWLVLERATGTGIGFVGFKGVPDAQGESEIGYGLAPGARGKGYATEAVGAFCSWAFTHPELKVVTATTVTNPDSNRVLVKLGAKVVNQAETSTDWKILRGALTHEDPRQGRGPSEAGVV